MLIRHSAWFAFAFLTFALLPVEYRVANAQSASDRAPIEYRLDFTQAYNHYVTVQATYPTDGVSELDLMMAVWTPGSYMVREYARHVERIAATNAEGEALPIEKSAKNRWTVVTHGAGTVQVSYRLYCRDMSVRTNFVDESMAVLNGAATFLTVADQLDRAHRVKVDLPDGWKRSITALESDDEDNPNSFLARDFDHLVDSPILVGNPSVFPFTVGDREHWLVNIGDQQYWEGAQAAKDVAKIVAEHQRMWGTIPYRRYLFLNVIGESGGGLEHDESTLMMTSRWSFRIPNSYQRWLGLVSHEFFHAWNIRSLRPKALVEYDYESENYFRSLWIAEGITSYYDDLALVRCGLIDQKKYLDQLSGLIRGVQRTPGRQVQSLSDSSHDAWIKFYHPNENSRNTQISYYSKGAIVGFLLDAKLRELTGNQKSLDDVMRQLYQRHSGDRGYSEDEFRNLASEVAGEDLTDWFRLHIDSTDELDYSSALKWYGLQMGAVPAEDDETGDESTSEAAAETENEEEDAGTPWTGMSTRDEDGRLNVTGVTRGSPAANVGINVDDEIIAVDGHRVSASNLSRVLEGIGVGETVDILIARRGKLQTVQMELIAEERLDWRVKVLKEPSEAQQAALKAWLSRGM